MKSIENLLQNNRNWAHDISQKIPISLVLFQNNKRLSTSGLGVRIAEFLPMMSLA